MYYYSQFDTIVINFFMYYCSVCTNSSCCGYTSNSFLVVPNYNSWLFCARIVRKNKNALTTELHVEFIGNMSKLRV